MSVTIEDLIVVTGNFISFLDKKRIVTLDDVRKLCGQEFRLSPPHFIKIEVRPSNFGTSAYTMSYISENAVGIPLETKSNEELDYSQIILKAGRQLPGYAPFSVDHYHNIVQAKRIETAQFSEVRKELEGLLGLDTESHRH